MSSAPDNQQEEVIIGQSRMSDGKRQALEVTEGAREKDWLNPSFASQLFMGTFDLSMLHPFPRQTEEDRKVGDEYVEKLSTYLKENLDPDEVDANREIPEAVMDGMRDLGVFRMKIPKKYGGLGFSQVNYNRVIMLLGSYCSSTATLVSAHQSIGVPQPLKSYGTDEQKEKYFPKLVEGTISAFALTEPNVGSDPAQMSMTAEPTEDGSEYILNGDKLWCTNGPIAGLIVVMARTPSIQVRGKEKKQISSFIVEMDTSGIEIVHRCDFMGLKAIQNGLLRFTDVRIPKENMLGEAGRGLANALATLNVGRLSVPALCLGGAKAALSVARRWGVERVQWGSPVGMHELGQHKVATIAAKTFAMEALVWLTSHWADRQDVDIRMEAAMAKVFCSEASWEITDMLMQFRGGRGYETAQSLKARGEAGHPVERMMRDARISLIVEGTSEIMRLFLARESMDQHLQLLTAMIRPGTALVDRIKAAGNLLGFYATWYPRQWVHGAHFSSHREVGSLAKHFRFIEATSHRLARTLFHAMALYRDGLIKKQNLLCHLVDIGTLLFAMAATCSYAVKVNTGAMKLADLFCSQSRRQIRDHFKAIRHHDHKKENPLADEILEGKFRWLETGRI